MTADRLVFKICTAAEWETAVRSGSYEGSSDDARDGFIHLSTAEQLSGTAAKYFAGKPNLVLVAYAEGDLAATLRWEPSRGGQLFPHVYGSLPPSGAKWVVPLPLGADGLPLIPKDL